MTTEQLISLFRIETEDLIRAVVGEYYFLTGTTPYASEAEVKSTILLAKRKAYMTVNIAGVEYWFQPDLTTLVAKVGDLSLANKAVTLAKMNDIVTGSFIGRNTAGTGVPEVLSIATVKTMLGIVAAVDISTALGLKVDKANGYSLMEDALRDAILEYLNADSKVESVADHSLVPDAEIEKLASIIPPQKILLPASGSVAGRISGATVPAGWSLSADATNLIITHNLTGKNIAFVNVFTVSGTVNKACAPFQIAYSGFESDGLTVTIKGLNPSPVALRIELIFN